MADNKTDKFTTYSNGLDKAIQDLTYRNAASVSPNEQFNGIGTALYGGLEGKDGVNSELGNWGKVWEAATGRKWYNDGDTVNNRMFNQQVIFSRETYAALQPFMKGRFIFVPIQMPPFMEKIFPSETLYIRRIFQTCLLSITGFNSRSMEYTTVNTTTDWNSYDIAVKQTGATRSLTFGFIPLDRSLSLYRYASIWLQMVYNQGSSAATYPYFTGMTYHEGNHTMTGIYVITDPSFQLVHAGAAIYGMMPKDINSSTIYDQTWGDHTVEPYSINFKVQVLDTTFPKVAELCQAVLNDYNASVALHDLTRTFNGDEMLGLGANIFGEAGKQGMADYEEATMKQ